MINIPIISY